MREPGAPRDEAAAIPATDPTRPDPAHSPAARAKALLPALIAGQLGLHAAMAGLRLAAPLQALNDGASAWAVGVLLALFAAAPVFLALWAGRLADRHGYHRPVHLAVAASVGGLGLACVAAWADAQWRFGLLCVAAALAGSAANIGLIAIQRTAGLAARDSVERMRIFSWLGIAPSFSNVLGPVSAGFLIDAAGYGVTYAVLLSLPLITLAAARFVPRPGTGAAVATAGGTAWELLGVPGMKRLLTVNWLLSACWDVHAFAVPILGHDRGFSASTIGLVLGTFTLSVTVVRLVIPWLAHRLDEIVVLRAAMIGTAAVFAAYPFAAAPWVMGALAALLGVTLGSVQPMVMSTLHQLTPHERHGEALAFRSMTINAASTLMPLLFGAAGTLVGAGVLFWVVGSAVGAGSWLAGGLNRAASPRG